MVSPAPTAPDEFAAPASDLNAIKRIADAHGFCLIQNAFTGQEMADLESGLANVHKRFPINKPDLLSCPELSWLLFDERVLSIARKLAGNELVYYGETSLNYEPAIGDLAYKTYNNLHIDATGRRDDLAGPWKGAPGQIFRGYRFGIYFRDYKRSSGGLKVAPGTHLAGGDFFRRAKSNSKEIRFTLDSNGGTAAFIVPDMQLHNVPNVPGDIVVWNLRTMHAARAQRLAVNPTFALPPDAEDALQEKAPHAFLPQAGARNAIFFDLSAPVEEVDLYIKNRSRRLLEESTDLSGCNYETSQTLAESHGIRLRYDKLILNLAIQLVRGQDSDGRLQKRLHHLASQHEEYSPFFPLFSREEFARLAKLDAAQATLMVAKQAFKAANAARVGHGKPAG